MAYLGYNGINPVYLKTDTDNKVVHSSITSVELFRIIPLPQDAFYNFEEGYVCFEKIYIGKRKKIHFKGYKFLEIHK